ncbi:At1g43920 Chloroplastic [Fagus crenata]
MANRYLAYVDEFVEYKEPTYNLKSLSSKSSQRVFETLNKDVTAKFRVWYQSFSSRIGRIIGEGFIFYMMSTPEDSEKSAVLKCTCALPAKLRLSDTPKNPFRLFYNCSKGIPDQCGFFRWADEPAATGDIQTDEVNLIRNECTRLQRRLGEIEQEHINERTLWDEEKSDLISQITTIQAELEEIKKKIKIANESDLMPPLDKVSVSDDEADDDAVIVHSL